MDILSNLKYVKGSIKNRKSNPFIFFLKIGTK